jgi:hypothetical protein
MGALGAICGSGAPRTQDSPTLSPFALGRQVSAVRAVGGSSACTDLCGGRWATGVPTATRVVKKGLATHLETESCEGGREAALEALTGACAGRV